MAVSREKGIAMHRLYAFGNVLLMLAAAILFLNSAGRPALQAIQLGCFGLNLLFFWNLNRVLRS